MTETTALEPKTQAAPRMAALLPAAAMVFVAGLLWFGLTIDQSPLIDRDEPWIAEVARQMVHRGDYLLPYLPAWEYKSIFKPPMAMWTIAGSFHLFGVNEFAARLPSAIFAALTAAILFVAAGRRWGTAAGFVAAAVVILPLLPAVVGRMVLTDPLLMLVATIVLLCLDRSLRTGGCHRCNVAIWMLTGLSLLIKGPAMLAYLCPAVVLAADGFRWKRYLLFCAGMLLLVAAVNTEGHTALRAGLGIPGGLAVIYCALRWLRPMLRLPIGLAWGLPLMLAVGGWWFVYVSAVSNVHEGSAKRYLFFEVLTRIVEPIEGHSGPPGYYVGILALGLLPFTAALVPLAGWSRRHRREDTTRSLLWAWALGGFLLFEIATTKMPHYLLLAFPALGLAGAMWWHESREPRERLSKARALGLVLPVLLLTLPLAALTTLAWHTGLRTQLANRLGRSDPDAGATVAWLGQFETWQISALAAVVVLLVATCIVAAAMSRRYDLRRGLVALAGGWVPTVGLLVVVFASPGPFTRNLSHEAAMQAVKMGRADTHYYAVGYTEPAVFYYLPPDRYTRIARGEMDTLAETEGAYVLICSRKPKDEGRVREILAGRILAEVPVSGINAAKGRPEDAIVFEIGPR